MTANSKTEPGTSVECPAPSVQILILRQGDARYEEILGGLRADADLLAYMWQAAESRLDEHPDKVWVIAAEGGRALAWAAYQPTTEGGAEIKATNSFERPEAWDDDWYGVVYAARHELIQGSDAITYVYPEPLEMHLQDGWQITADGWSDEPDAPSHHWYELRRVAD